MNESEVLSHWFLLLAGVNMKLSKRELEDVWGDGGYTTQARVRA